METKIKLTTEEVKTLRLLLSESANTSDEGWNNIIKSIYGKLNKQNKSNSNKVFPGYWFSNEHCHKVNVLAVVNGFCMVQDYDKDEPYILPLEFVQEIKDATDSLN